VNDNIDKELRELRRQIADDLSYRRKGKATRRLRASHDFKLPSKILILGRTGLFLGIALITLVSGGSVKRPPENPTSTKQPGLRQVKEKKMLVKGIEDKIVILEKQERELQQLQQSLIEMDRAGRSLKQQVDELSQVVDKLQKRMGSGVTSTEPTRLNQRKPGSSTKRLSHTEAPLTIRRMPLSPPKRRYHEVRPGEYLRLIAQRYGTSVDELCKLNHITSKQVLHPGQKLLVIPGNHE
jgi:LysM repeat protein